MIHSNHFCFSWFRECIISSYQSQDQTDDQNSSSDCIGAPSYHWSLEGSPRIEAVEIVIHRLELHVCVVLVDRLSVHNWSFKPSERSP